MNAATLQPETPPAIDYFFCRDIPEPFQILGLRLLPLSIGRYRRMARHGIGFVSESATRATGADLIVGVLICSMPCAEWDALAISADLPALVASWLNQINAVPPWYLTGKYGRILSATWVGRRWRNGHSFDLLEKMRMFKAYIEAAQAVPKFLRRPGADGGMSTAHWSHNIEVALRAELGWSEDEINERPLSKALADYFKLLESHGIITILTEEDFAQIKSNDEAVQKAIADYMARLDGKGSEPC